MALHSGRGPGALAQQGSVSLEGYGPGPQCHDRGTGRHGAGRWNWGLGWEQQGGHPELEEEEVTHTHITPQRQAVGPRLACRLCHVGTGLPPLQRRGAWPQDLPKALPVPPVWWCCPVESVFGPENLIGKRRKTETTRRLRALWVLAPGPRGTPFCCFQPLCLSQQPWEPQHQGESEETFTHPGAPLWQEAVTDVDRTRWH